MHHAAQPPDIVRIAVYPAHILIGACSRSDLRRLYDVPCPVPPWQRLQRIAANCKYQPVTRIYLTQMLQRYRRVAYAALAYLLVGYLTNRYAPECEPAHLHAVFSVSGRHGICLEGVQERRHNDNSVYLRDSLQQRPYGIDVPLVNRVKAAAEKCCYHFFLFEEGSSILGS